jgi:hypothetical protein
MKCNFHEPNRFSFLSGFISVFIIFFGMIPFGHVLAESSFNHLNNPMTSSLTLGDPSFGGTGCPAGTAHFVLTPDQTALSVLFDQYRVEAGNGTPMETKACNASIPIQIPASMSLQVFEVDYRGFNSLPKGASSNFITHYRFEGGTQKKEKKDKPFRGPLVAEFLDSDKELVRSPCGGIVKLNILTQFIVRTNSKQDQAFSEIDSSDMSSTDPHNNKKRKIQYKLKLKRCNE